MTESTHNYITTATLRILRPLVRILIRNGMAYGTLAELLRKTYVDVGFEMMEQSGRRPTVSGVSGITGLTRKETKRLSELKAPDTEAADQRYNRAIRVISGWSNDRRFLDDGGRPALLPIEGEHSFNELVKQYSGDIPASAMLMVLRDAQCIADEDGKLRLTSHAYIPRNDPSDKINILGVDTAELISTVDHNLTANPGQLWFQRKVSTHQLKPEALEAFKLLSAKKAQQLLEELDGWLSEHEVDDTSEQPRYVAMGIFYTEGLDKKE